MATGYMYVLTSDATKGLISYTGKTDKFTSRSFSCSSTTHKWTPAGVTSFTAVPLDGCAFKGWRRSGIAMSYSSVGSDGTLVVDTTYKPPYWSPSSDEKTYIYADFVPKFRVVFDGNGSTSGEMPDGEGVDSVEYTIPECGYSRTGYAFAGWSTSRDGEVEYLPGDTYLVEGIDKGFVLNLFAIWSRTYIGFKITSSHDGGRLTLLKDGEPVASSSSGVLLHEDYGEPGKYSISCEPYELYIPLGVLVDGEYVTEFTPSPGDLVEGMFHYEEKRLYSLSYPDSVSTEMVPHKDGKWIEGTAVELKVSPPAGRYLSYYTIRNGEGEAVRTESNPKSNDIVVTMTSDMSLTVGFGNVKYDFTVSVDGASSHAGTASSSRTGKVEYGDKVVCTAEPASGFWFSGWYVGGERVSSESPYTHEVSGDTEVVARFGVDLSFSVGYGEGTAARDASLLVDGEPGVPMPVKVELGESVQYELDAGSWFFDGWTSGGAPVPYDRSGTISPTTQTSLSTVLVKSQPKRTLKVFPMRKTGDDSSVSGYAHFFEDGLVTTEVVSRGPGLQGASPVPCFEFQFDGTKTVVVHAVQSESGGKSFGFFAVKSADGQRWEVLSTALDYEVLMNGDKDLYACYGEVSRVEISVGFADGSDRTMGTVYLDGESSAESVDGTVSKEVMQLTSVVVQAVPKNGFAFAGWFTTRQVQGEPYEDDAGPFEYMVPATIGLYARFVKDSHAVYEWEGSRENKMMTWKSRLFVAPRPFSPSACRVDTDGYPLKLLKVEMYSSPTPNSPPAATSELKNIESQSPRRLPKRRPERYLQFTVENDSEVDSVVVGTSMEGMLE